MTHSDDTQTAYNVIGGHYQNVKDLPCAVVETASVHTALGSVQGMHVLDLACGTGFYARQAARDGAATVLGVDMSSSMIDTARDEERREPLSVTYEVADVREAIRFGSFNIILAAWLLNYTDELSEMTAMFTTVADNLAPGGLFVGVTQNPWFDFHGADPSPYGWSFVPGEIAEHGTRVRATAHIDPPIGFSTWFPNAESYTTAAWRAGLEAPRWEPLVVPPGEFWNGLRSNPCLAVLCLRKEAVR
ncbi:class I SAM-dependent methyltransferase [Actinopolyspora halophila]|uniref:class I SAM-dependent methyltransferase n=1 Tax=Actinopolyspora halophila TaxID=1850 RepID=UPI00036131A9|nr:class I SAM-dependent methyltransferase [Actinopolyspora halophila]